MVRSAGDWATKAMPLEKSQMTTTIDSKRGGRVNLALLFDHIGRKNAYFVYITLGVALYVTMPYAGANGNIVQFVICFVVIVSYSGGFSTVSAYPRNMYGIRYVGAIHGILFTAWSATDRHRQACADQLHPRIQRQPWLAEGAGLQHHHVHHGRIAGCRLPCQSPRQSVRQPSSHEIRSGCRD